MQAVIRLVPGTVVSHSGPPPFTTQSGQYFIDILDDTGNPINGDNVIVPYRQIKNGVSQALQTVVVPGMSVRVFNGFIHVTGSMPTNISYIIDGDLTPGTPAPPIAPDLTLVSIQITKKADSAGNGGEIKINATSSNLPINYTVDDVLSSGNGVFINLTAGVHRAKISDPTGTIIEQDFTVPKQDSILAVDPSKTVNGLVSRWNAAFNPIVFEYHRKDYQVLAISQDSATLKPKITLNTGLAGLTIGDYVYLDAGIKNTLSAYKGAFKVLSFSGSDIIIDADYVAPDSISGFANIDALRPYYKVLTKIKAVDPATGLFKTTTSTNRDINGIVKADISSYLQSILKPVPSLSDYTQVNFRDAGLAASYQISYAETWEGNTPVFTDIEAPFYVTWSAGQLQQSQAVNMFDFVTQPGGTQLAKWLTDFIEPAYSTGFPFDLGFIYSEQIAGRQLYSKITLLDYNRQPLGTADITTFLLNEDGSYLLNQDGSKLIIARQQLVNTPIVEHVGLNRLLISQDFGPECWYLQIQLFYDESSAHIPVTQPIIVRVDKVCPTQWVYIRWIGLNGSWNYYRFNYNQTLTYDIQNPVIIKQFVSDWENGETIEQVISKDASSKLQLYADLLSKNDIDGLRSLKSGVNCQYLTSKSPLKWQTIVVNSSTFTEYDTQNEYFDFGITFNLPSINNQTN